ncbi:MAG: alpha/beta hydrolase [Clostridia bacterium]|nr:alpha/beta hydrolase [Clostridia bacterium]
MSESTETRGLSGQYIQAGGRKIRYYEEGEGENLLMIHGIGQAMYTFRRNVHALSEYCRVITVDLIGHGLSDKPDCAYTIDDFTEMLVDFIDAMELKELVLAGFSTGGIIALNLAVKHPDLIRKLVLLTPGGLTKTCPATLRRAAKPLLSDFVFTFFRPHTVRKVLLEAYYDPRMASKSVVNHYFKVLSHHDNLDACLRALAAWNDSAVMDSLSLVKAPVYLFWGEDDTWHPLSMMERFEDELPDVYSATFGECGHLPHEEHAEEFNKKLIEIVTSGD